MQSQEHAHIWSVSHLNNLNLLRANFIRYAFKRHTHDYFVIGLVEGGVQQFDYQREHYTTLPGQLIVINPGEAHTGEAAIPSGFRYRAFYPEAEVFQRVVSDIKGRWHDIPFFTQPLISDPALFAEVRSLHVALEAVRSTLEHESRYLQALARLLIRHVHLSTNPVRREKAEIRRLRQYIEEYYAEDIKLADLAQLVNWNAYYLLRVFRSEVGLPPHAYLENVRIRQAQALLKRGCSLAQVAYETGFSSQSHFTTTFKRVLSVTPGQYRSIF